MKARLHVTFLDGTEDTALVTEFEVGEGMLIGDFGGDMGQVGYNIRAMKSWYTEPVED